MAREKLLADLLPGRVAVGLSSFIGLTAIAGQNNISIEYMSGGTLEIVHTGAMVSWGQGFVAHANVIYSFDAIGTIWVASSGATTMIQVLRGRSQGFEGASG